MFTTEERMRLRRGLLEDAAADLRISGAAITGSAAWGAEDRWSDIDLAFGVCTGIELEAVLSDWTARMYEKHYALHHTDVHFGAWVYRVFLLANTLQVDLAFVAQAEFRALAPSFRLMHGESNAAGEFPKPDAEALVGLGWLHALHARSCIGRGKLWQAEYMVSGMRDQTLALACLRHGVPVAHARGFDLLPGDVTTLLQESLVRELERDELSRAFRVVTEGLRREVRHLDESLASRLDGALRSLAETDALAQAGSH